MVSYVIKAATENKLKDPALFLLRSLSWGYWAEFLSLSLESFPLLYFWQLENNDIKVEALPVLSLTVSVQEFFGKNYLDFI